MKERTAYVVHLKDRSNCSRIESAKPGKDIPILVVPENDVDAPPLPAIGRLSNDKTLFSIVVKSPPDEHVWDYQWLLEAIHNRKPAT